MCSTGPHQPSTNNSNILVDYITAPRGRCHAFWGLLAFFGQIFGPFESLSFSGQNLKNGLLGRWQRHLYYSRVPQGPRITKSGLTHLGDWSRSVPWFSAQDLGLGMTTIDTPSPIWNIRDCDTGSQSTHWLAIDTPLIWNIRVCNTVGSFVSKF